MPANRDKDQKYGFFYQNLYQLYRKGGAESVAEPDDKGVVLKVEPVATEPRLEPEVAKVAEGDPTFEGLRTSLARLQDLHGRLRFMLEELEDLAAQKKKS